MFDPQFNYILVPLDGSELAEAAIPAALELAGRFESDILLLRVLPPLPAVTFMEGGVYTDLYSQLHKLGHQEAIAYLQAKQETLESQGYRVFVQVREGAPADTIIETAKREKVDTIVMSTRGRSGIQRWMLGSVAEQVLRQADMPVLLIRVQEKPEQEAEPAPAERGAIAWGG